VRSSTEFGGNNYYDLVTFFDCFHDFADPEAAARHVRDALKPNGTCMIVEFVSGDRLEDNLNPLSRACYAASVFICLPASLAQKGAAGLGLLPGETRIREIMTNAGFTKFRRAYQGAFNMVLEAHA
jgi:SAM-dependent methyltransferase